MFEVAGSLDEDAEGSDTAVPHNLEDEIGGVGGALLNVELGDGLIIHSLKIRVEVDEVVGDFVEEGEREEEVFLPVGEGGLRR